MATEDDKTNTGIAGTAIAVGVAAMIAGSTAIVGMARTEIDEWSTGSSAYADLSSVKALESEQATQLASAKLPIDKARQLVLADIKRDADQASPWTPKSPAPEASTATGAETAPATDAAASDGSAATSGAAPAGSAAAPQAATAGSESAPPAPETSAAPAPTAATTH